MDLETAIKNRRSIRNFKKDKIHESTIKELINAGTQAPSACNKQHWQFIIIKDEEIKNKLYNEAKTQKVILNAPVIIAVLCDKRHNADDYANIQSCAAATQNILLKATQKELGTCWICAMGNQKIVKKILNVPEHYDVINFILLGKPAEKPKQPTRKQLKDVTHYESYEQNKDILPTTTNPKEYSLEQIKNHQIYLSRAKEMGTDYEIHSKKEINKIKKTISEIKGENLKILNLIGYDGSILKQIISLLKNHHFIDAELSKQAIDFVKYKTNQPEFIIMDNYKLSLKDNSIDLIISPFSLEKLPSHSEILTEFKRILKKDGQIIIFMKNKNSIHGLMNFAIEKILKIRNMDISFISSGPFAFISYSKLKNKLKKIDMETNAKTLFFMPSELLIYNKKISSYLKKHGSRIKHLKWLIKPSLILLILLSYLTFWIKLPRISSSIVIYCKNINKAPN